MKRYLAIVFSVVLAFAYLVFAQKDNKDFYVTAITDGDTITVIDNDNNQIKIRLAEIDAPEKKQDFGQKSKEVLSEKIYNKYIQIEKISIDRYKRTIAKIYYEGRNINEEMVKEGFAWHYKEFSKSNNLDKLQEEAKNKKIGLWSEKDPVYPPLFRKK